MRDDWVKAAMTDDSMVADLLMRLNPLDVSVSSPVERLAAALPFGWGVRQPRSRQWMRCKKEGESTRASPTTPLSWSGGTSLSGGVVGGGACDGYEESSRLVRRSNSGRSKFQGTVANGTTIRRSRKKKSFAELKEEESFLLKERMSLKKELTALHLTFEEQRMRNNTLKRMKLDLQSQSARKTSTGSDAFEEAVSDQPQHSAAAATVDHTATVFPMSVACDEPNVIVFPSLVPACEVQKKDDAPKENLQKKYDAPKENFFVLPDLNMPIEVDSGSETLYGMS